MSNRDALIDTASVVLRQQKGVTIAYINAQSLNECRDGMRLLLSHSRVDIMLIGESHLNDTYIDEEFDVPNYSFCRFDRDGGMAGNVVE